MRYEIKKNENLTLLHTLAEQTACGKFHWDHISYTPISLMHDVDVLGEESTYLCHILDAATNIDGAELGLEITETIDISSNKGDIAVTFTTGGSLEHQQVDYILSRELLQHEDAAAEDFPTLFADHICTILADAFIPLAENKDVLDSAYQWASYCYTKEIPLEYEDHPLIALGERLWQERKPVDFHRCILDTVFRNTI